MNLSSVPLAKQTRRSQVERSGATRGALLDAAIACLIEEGYAGTTTGKVSEMAGLSRGAHLHHFGTRATLLAAALAELARRRDADFKEQIKGLDLPMGVERIDFALDSLWEWFTGPLFHASVDLSAAARTDDELRASLIPVEQQLNDATLSSCRELFAGGCEDSSCDQLIQMTIATVRGLALLPILQPGTQKATKQWTFARRTLRRLFNERQSRDPTRE
jgi:AcrR family transcriptional regulator